MSTDIQVTVVQQTIGVSIIPQTIEVTLPGVGIVHTHRMGQIEAEPFVDAVFANPLNLSCSQYKSWRCTITGDTVINLLNVVNGEDGMLELIIDGVGGHAVTLGTMFTIKLGVNSINTFAGKKNILSWRKSFDDIIYTIAVA